ncbi:MAG: amidohydrolase family protein [Kiritimatiellae bacterium]|nr:amidohydrolase family protein [Kiritimatiellia bacterium]
MKTLIMNGTIVDGSGKDAFRGDVLVEGEKILAVERKIAEADCQRVDATGKLVTPGFIDAHTHSDAYLVIEPDAPSKLSQGITTEINGQCGGSVAPRFGEARLSSDWASVLGDKLTWRSLAEYREVLSAARPAVNTVQFIGHNTLRSSVVGYAGRAASEDELKAMERMLEKSLDEGGYGLTTGLIYQPGKYSTPEEVRRLAQVTARKGGFYATHMRSEGDRILEAIDEVLELVEATGIRAEISHLKTSGRRNWGKIDAVLDKLEGAIAKGRVLGSDRYPFCAAGTDLDVVFPDWAGEGAAKAECERLADPTLRAKIVAEIDVLDRDWQTVMIGGTWDDSTRAYSGKRVSEIMAETGLGAGETVCRILERDQCRTGAFFFGMSEDNLDQILLRDWIVPGSDASLRAPWGVLGQDHPHPRAYSTMPEFLRCCRALGLGLEKVVARMTDVPARRFELSGRGRLEAGYFADVIVWDENGFKGNATYLKPHQFASGMEMVMVNGTVSYLAGRFTGQRNGKFLERKP